MAKKKITVSTPPTIMGNMWSQLTLEEKVERCREQIKYLSENLDRFQRYQSKDEVYF
jgi:hypothetical protein